MPEHFAAEITSTPPNQTIEMAGKPMQGAGGREGGSNWGAGTGVGEHLTIRYVGGVVNREGGGCAPCSTSHIFAR